MEPKRKVVTRAEWTKARVDLLEKEKQLTRMRDALSAQRRHLPWVRIDKPYIFDTPDGKQTLSQLFDGRSQLFVKHFMFGPGWKEGCVGCSFEVDHIEGTLVHLSNHDVTCVMVSRAPLAELEAFRRRMGWQIKWVSSQGSSFNYDFHVSFTPEQVKAGRGYYNYREMDMPIEEASGNSVFYRDDDGSVYHTYSAYGRGMEELLGSYIVLDATPKGRNEGERGNLTDWVRLHDRYATGGRVEPTGRNANPGDGEQPDQG